MTGSCWMLGFSVFRPPEGWKLNLERAWANGPSWRSRGAVFTPRSRKVLGCPWPRYAPEYTKCIEHFALHAGGYAVLKGIQKGMGLPIEMMLPSFASLRDYGNTSSSTTWYSLAYLERFGMVKQGQRIMQVGAGGGMKGGVNIWQVLRDTRDPHPAWMHVERPYTEHDMPRSISDPKRPAAKAAAATAGAPDSETGLAAAEAAAAAAATSGGRTAPSEASADGACLAEDPAGGVAAPPAAAPVPAPAAGAAAAAYRAAAAGQAGGGDGEECGWAADGNVCVSVGRGLATGGAKRAAAAATAGVRAPHSCGAQLRRRSLSAHGGVAAIAAAVAAEAVAEVEEFGVFLL